jgi:outer membrane protein assembly factor BamA
LKKKLLSMFLILNFSLIASPILKINISGNKNVSTEKILSLIKTRQGNDFDENLIKKDIEVTY